MSVCVIGILYMYVVINTLQTRTHTYTHTLTHTHAHACTHTLTHTLTHTTRTHTHTHTHTHTLTLSHTSGLAATVDVGGRQKVQLRPGDSAGGESASCERHEGGAGLHRGAAQKGAGVTGEGCHGPRLHCQSFSCAGKPFSYECYYLNIVNMR